MAKYQSSVSPAYAAISHDEGSPRNQPLRLAIAKERLLARREDIAKVTPRLKSVDIDIIGLN
jgi:hypothetical protein